MAVFNINVPLSYLPSLSINIFCMQCGTSFCRILNMSRPVLSLTMSTNLNDCEFKNKWLACSQCPKDNFEKLAKCMFIKCFTFQHDVKILLN